MLPLSFPTYFSSCFMRDQGFAVRSSAERRPFSMRTDRISAPLSDKSPVNCAAFRVEMSLFMRTASCSSLSPCILSLINITFFSNAGSAAVSSESSLSAFTSMNKKMDKRKIRTGMVRKKYKYLRFPSAFLNRCRLVRTAHFGILIRFRGMCSCTFFCRRQLCGKTVWSKAIRCSALRNSSES